jgi:hypothetical protein
MFSYRLFNLAEEGIKISDTLVKTPKIPESFFVITSSECRVTQRRDMYLKPATVRKKF